MENTNVTEQSTNEIMPMAASGETNFASLPEKATPASGDMFLMEDSEDTKKINYDKLADAILNKLTSKTYSGLETTAKNFVTAINELNSKSTYLRGIPMINPELLSSGQTLLDYVTNNFSSNSSLYFFGIPSTLTSEQKTPFPGTGGFAILYNSSTTGYSSIYAFSYNVQIKVIRTLDGTWDSDWADL